MSTEPLEDRWDALLFGVRRSSRYHNRRRRFFEGWHNVTSALNVIFSSATIATLLKSDDSIGIAAAFAVVISILSAIDLVVGTSRKAWLHADFAKRFIGLEKQMTRLPAEKDFQRLCIARLDIEAEEPPVLHVLNTICHNELLRALGYPEEKMIPLTLCQRLYAPFFDFREHAIAAPETDFKAP